MNRYEEDKLTYVKVNDGVMTRATWNLLISIRDVKLWKAGIRPHRHWRLKHVKEYFGVLGSADFVLRHLLKLKAELDAKKTNIELPRHYF